MLSIIKTSMYSLTDSKKITQNQKAIMKNQKKIIKNQKKSIKHNIQINDWLSKYNIKNTMVNIVFNSSEQNTLLQIIAVENQMKILMNNITKLPNANKIRNVLDWAIIETYTDLELAIICINNHNYKNNILSSVLTSLQQDRFFNAMIHIPDSAEKTAFQEKFTNLRNNIHTNLSELGTLDIESKNIQSNVIKFVIAKNRYILLLIKSIFKTFKLKQIDIKEEELFSELAAIEKLCTDKNYTDAIKHIYQFNNKINTIIGYIYF